MHTHVHLTKIWCPSAPANFYAINFHLKLLWSFDYLDFNGNVCHLRAFWRQSIVKRVLEIQGIENPISFCQIKCAKYHKLHTWKTTTHKHIARTFQKYLCTHIAHVQMLIHMCSWALMAATSRAFFHTQFHQPCIKYLVIYLHTQAGWVVDGICLRLLAKICS